MWCVKTMHLHLVSTCHRSVRDAYRSDDNLKIQPQSAQQYLVLSQGQFLGYDYPTLCAVGTWLCVSFLAHPQSSRNDRHNHLLTTNYGAIEEFDSGNRFCCLYFILDL